MATDTSSPAVVAWRLPGWAPLVPGTLLLLVIGLLALACTLAIHLVYDALWGPDPARFGFLTNFGMEFALVAFHVLAAAVVNGLRRVATRSVRPLNRL